jgi:glycosyltransferase involved in cell wall biosynthesis
MKSIIINATNLHSGGGVQVASSFIFDLSLSELEYDFSISIYISSTVYENLLSLDFNLSAFKDVQIVNTTGIGSFFSSVSRVFNQYDLVFTIFGPNYSLFSKYINIVGFAQPWIIYPNNELSSQQKVISRITTKAKFFIQKIFFKRADRLVVELEHVRYGLQKTLGYQQSKIDVVYNSYSPAFDFFKEHPLPNLTRLNDTFSIGFLSRDYPHKNLDILPIVKQALLQEYNISTDFYVTLTNDEWENKSDDFRRDINNVGSLTVAECPSFYQRIDAVLFPSLLECFSATPLETMISGIPLFASNRAFVRDVCKEHAYYIDPLNPTDIAKKIADYINLDCIHKKEKLMSAKVYASTFSSSRGRSQKYLNIINKSLNE